MNKRLIDYAKNGDVESVKRELEAGADVHYWNDYALWISSDGGHTEIVKLLLNAGANSHASGGFALIAAKHNNHTEVVKILKNHMKEV